MTGAPAAGRLVRMIKLFTSQQMRELDRAAIEQYGVAGVVLMEHAGVAVARAAVQLLPPDQRHVCVLCGKGNNGGDGLVAARWLRRWGYVPEVFLFGEGEAVGGDARINLQLNLKSGHKVEEIKAEADLVLLHGSLRRCALVIDALLGTGVSGPPREPLATAIRRVNEVGVPVLSVDLPSGVNADTGAVFEPQVRATATVTFGGWKRALATYPAAAAAGRVELADIGLPEPLLQAVEGVPQLVETGDIVRILPPRPPWTHKGSAGRVLVVGGSRGMGGAPLLAGRAALRAGAGLVSCAMPIGLVAALEAGLLEATAWALPEDEDGAVAMGAADYLRPGLGELDAVCIGPGLGTSSAAAELLAAVVSTLDVPLVVDADALNLAARQPALLQGAGGSLVLTPHPGEAARLLDITAADVQADRFGAAADLARRFGAMVVLKGAYSVIASPAGRLFVNPTGNAAMASGGMGDALTGVLGALLGQGLGVLEATLAAVWLHGRAGDLAAAGSDAGVIASDVIEHLPRARAELRA